MTFQFYAFAPLRPSFAYLRSAVPVHVSSMLFQIRSSQLRSSLFLLLSSPFAAFPSRIVAILFLCSSGHFKAEAALCHSLLSHRCSALYPSPFQAFPNPIRLKQFPGLSTRSFSCAFHRFHFLPSPADTVPVLRASGQCFSISYQIRSVISASSQEISSHVNLPFPEFLH